MILPPALLAELPADLDLPRDSVLLAGTAGITRLQSDGIPQTEQFLNQVDSKSGQELIGKHFPGGAGSPAIILTNAPATEQVTQVFTTTLDISRRCGWP